MPAIVEKETVIMSLERDDRLRIDEQLVQAGWVVQNVDEINVMAGEGVAIREFPLNGGRADYLLVVNGEAVGVIEAKKAGTTLTGIKEQSERYQFGQPLNPTSIRFTRTPMPFSYEATSVEIFFTNGLEPEASSRRVFHYHRPQTLAGWLQAVPAGTPNEQNDLLRSRLRVMPDLTGEGLRNCQFDAITNLEDSFALNRLRALVQMATGSGKTYMTVSSVYRLLKHGKAQRILFLVDRTNLALQALNQFQQYVTPDTGRKFTDLYNVQRLQGGSLDSTAEVCITTIQRLYSILTGKPLEQEKDEESLFQQEDLTQDEKRPQRTVTYNPAVPIEFFDVIFIDECHRSIYNEWRPALEYFDAFLVGLTATPENRAFAFFSRNLVYEYSQAQAVADGINVDYDVYYVNTQITTQGSRVERGNLLWFRNKLTRARTYELLTDDLIYEGRHLDYDVVTPDQIRTVIRAYKESLSTDLFPGREGVPKTLIFAKHDGHADDIVQIVREEFAQGNDFAKKITYRVPRAVDLINQFCNSYYPRIAVSVDMISTGTDIKPLEVLIFMRSIRSRTFFEQMKGRGCRSMDDEAFKLVTPFGSKTRYILFDAVDVTRGLSTDSPPLDRRPSVPLEDLMQRAASGEYDENILLTLAGRIGALARRVREEEQADIARLVGGTLQDFAERLVAATDYQRQFDLAKQKTKPNDPTESEVEEAARQLAQEATDPFRNQELRDLLLRLRRRDKQAIDDISLDEILAQGFDTERAKKEITSFSELMEKNNEKIRLFEIALSAPIGMSLREGIQEVARNIEIPRLWPLSSDIEIKKEMNNIWRAYQQLEGSRVRGVGTKRYLTDIIALIRYTMQRNTDETAILEPYMETVKRRFDDWLNQQKTLRQQPFSERQLWWLNKICEVISVDLQCLMSDLENVGASKGGKVNAISVFGEQELIAIMRELNERLVA